MTIRFSIHFNTKWGEELFITGSSAEFGNQEIENAFKLNYIGNSIWEGEIKLNALKERIISYRYFVKNNDGLIYYETGKGRSIALNTATKDIITYDQWQGNTVASPFLSAPFSEVFFANENASYTQLHKHNNELIIRVTIPNITKTTQVLICGNTKNTGEWDVEKAVPMDKVEGLKWEANFNIEKKEGKILLYKFVLKDNITGKYTWEDGDNRTIVFPKIPKNNTVIIEHSSANFKSINPKFAGLVVPLFSLRSKNSLGIGDLCDLKLLIEWAKTTGQSIIQLLPINDTAAYINWKDSYPYNCISTLALHPIYVSLSEIGTIKDVKLNKALNKEGALLNHQVFLDYEDVWDFKMRFLRAIYNEQKENTFAEPGCYTFIKQNKEWLFPYAAFCVLRDKYKTPNFREWGDNAIFSGDLITGLTSKPSEYRNDILFYVFIQYHLHKQMTSVKEFAHANRVALKGDIPIGISRNSVEAWQYPTLFNFGQQAGAPPDSFSKEGQNWGFPTYNWKEMEKNNYAWWKARFTHFSNYFDAYRLDHILGFFRIWEIPIEYSSSLMGHFSPALPLSPSEIAQCGLAEINYSGLFLEDPYKKGTFHPKIGAQNQAEYKSLPPYKKEAYNKLYNSYFYERHNNFWYKQAIKKLQQLMASTNMLTCGEDLGMLNESVYHCLKNLKILSLELQQMPKQAGVSCGNPKEYPYLSVCTTSTHDIETLRMWLGKLYNQFSDMVGENGEQYYDATPTSCLNIIKENLASPSMLAIFPLQDWLSIDSKRRNKYADSERINNPENPQHHWRYRMHLDIEDLLEATDFNKTIKDLIATSSRTQS
ncbi:MAG: 4-alpha-glucanotransferase [Bacteroidales bacterium]